MSKPIHPALTRFNLLCIQHRISMSMAQLDALGQLDDPSPGAIEIMLVNECLEAEAIKADTYAHVSHAVAEEVSHGA